MSEPVRTCVGCRKRFPQLVLVRFVRSAAGWSADVAGRPRTNGRGVYLCGDACAARVVKNKRFGGLAAVAASLADERRRLASARYDRALGPIDGALSKMK